MIALKFNEADMNRAAAEWGCNCGPSALAAALGISLDRVRHLIPGFEQKGYTSPTMMKQAIAAADHSFTAISSATSSAWPDRGVVRIQFTGPWTKPGANPRWAYWHTHWVGSFRVDNRLLVFDCNGGLRTYDSWRQVIVPAITGSISRADGGWFPTHLWQLQQNGQLRQEQLRQKLLEAIAIAPDSPSSGKTWRSAETAKEMAKEMADESAGG